MEEEGFREVGSDEEYLLEGEGALVVGEVFTPWLKCLRWPWALPIITEGDWIGLDWIGEIETRN